MEESIGIEVFLTKSPKIGGKIKKYPEDFVVEELPVYPKPGDGKFVIARVKSYNWETNRLIEALASSLKISSNSVGYAGIKDKRAITSQIMSFPTSIDNLKKIKLRDVNIDILYKSREKVYRGNLLGNYFHIIVRDINGRYENVENVMNEILQIGGFPNFFGVQRFGVTRPITHLVGKYIIKNELKKAVMTYISYPMEGEDEESYRARKFLQETEDFEKSLEIYPKKLIFERRIIMHLAKNKDDWIGAISKLPKNLIKIFVHAYQSYLFNKILSERIKEGTPINKAIEGDVVIPFTGEIQSKDGIVVTKDNIEKINSQIEKGKCYPSAIIFGYNSFFAEGRMGEIERMIIEKEGINQEDFKVKSLPFLSCEGMRRIIFVPIKNLKWRLEENNLFIDFFLPKGCYATSLLREIMKGEIYDY
ncbi:MAG: tRNA pseudouridine(13) synthase TruD [Thermoplasmatales archaeon]|nr:tRNA pseudouridine(13) synthase TruD [Thermoplasmatales archaeon]